jgi:hypothetical protein
MPASQRPTGESHGARARCQDVRVGDVVDCDDIEAVAIEQNLQLRPADPRPLIATVDMSPHDLVF